MNGRILTRLRELVELDHEFPLLIERYRLATLVYCGSDENTHSTHEGLAAGVVHFDAVGKGK